jgi:hypothetical protein
VTLERDLRALADAFPDEPALAPRVMAAALQATARRRRRRRISLLALALLLLVPATALAVSGDLRDRVLESFGLRNVEITSVTRLPEASPDARRLQLGSRVSLSRARRDLRVRLGAPGALGAPDGIFEERLQSGVDITFLYEPRTVAKRTGMHERVIVSVLRGKTEKTILGKTIASATRTIPLEIDGGPALLLTGRPHLLVLFRAPGGGLDQTYTRLVGTTLLWQRGPLLVRIEGNLPRARLVGIARSLRDRF